MNKFFLFVSSVTLLAGISSCVVKEEGYHRHHDRVYVEERPAVEERIEVR